MSSPQRDKARAYLRRNPTATPYQIAAGSGCSARTARRVKAAMARCNGIGDDDAGVPLCDNVAALEHLFGFDRVGASHDPAGADIFPRKRDTVLFLYDIHLPYENADNIEMALSYAESRHYPTHIVLGGDCVDFQKVSRFVSPSDAMELSDEIAYAVKWLEKLRARFTGCKITYLVGNHEERLQRFIRTRSPELDGLKGLNIKEQLELDRLNIHLVDNLKLKSETGQFFSIGKLTILHGHELGICPSINPARQYFLRAMDNMICGHVHKVNDHYDNTLRDETKGAFVCGCLCDMHPSYKPQNGWVAGFGLCSWDEDGMFSMKLKKIINGRVL